MSALTANAAHRATSTWSEKLARVIPFAPPLLADASKLASLDNRALRELGRIGHPFVRRRGERGFTRVSWDDAHAKLGARLRAIEPSRLAFFVTARGVTNEVYYMAQK